MADTYDILTLDEAKSVLGIDLTDDADEDKVVSYNTAVARLLDQRVGPTVARTVTESHDGGCSSIKVRKRPVRSIASVTEYRGGVGTALTVSTAASPTSGYMAEAYPPDPDLLSGRIYRTTGTVDTQFAWGRQNITVVYSAGRYTATATVDARFKRAAALCLTNMWRDQQQSAGGFGEFDVPTASFPTFALPRAVEDLLADELWYQRGQQVW